MLKYLHLVTNNKPTLKISILPTISGQNHNKNIVCNKQQCTVHVELTEVMLNVPTMRTITSRLDYRLVSPLISS